MPISSQLARLHDFFHRRRNKIKIKYLHEQKKGDRMKSKSVQYIKKSYSLQSQSAKCTFIYFSDVLTTKLNRFSYFFLTDITMM